MAWIESHQELGRHPKTMKASRLLKINRHQMIGHLHSLWWWAVDAIPNDGSLVGLTDEDLAEGAEWSKRSAARFVQALEEAGFICRHGTHSEGCSAHCSHDEHADSAAETGSRFLHDWWEYAGKLNQRRDEDKARKKRERAQRRGRSEHEPPDSSDGRPQDIPGTSAGSPAPTVHIHNRTDPNGSTEPGDIYTARGAAPFSAAGESEDVKISAIEERLSRILRRSPSPKQLSNLENDWPEQVGGVDAVVAVLDDRLAKGAPIKNPFGVVLEDLKQAAAKRPAPPANTPARRRTNDYDALARRRLKVVGAEERSGD